MGKVKFTLANLWLWVSFAMCSLLSENISIFTTNKTGSLNITTLVIVSVASILTMFMYFFLEHKKNGMKVDWVLLPTLAIIYAFMVVGIWLAKDESFLFQDSSNSIDVHISNMEKWHATIILTVVMIFTYASTFCVFHNRPNSRTFNWLAYIGILVGYVSIIYSLIKEWKAYEAIFKADSLNDYIPIMSFYFNKNFYGCCLLVSLLCCVFANYHKKRFFNYFSMVIFTVFCILSICVLSALICAAALVIYLLIDTIHNIVIKKWKYTIYSTIYIFIVLGLILVFYLGVQLGWNIFKGMNAFVTKVYFSKDFSTFTGRKKIWEALLTCSFDSTIHTIFGHGYMISEKYILAITACSSNALDGGVRSAHNGFFQLMFQGGLVSLIGYLCLMGYFLYCSIRLVLQKKTYFVFTQVFCVLCLTAHNCCEVTLFFDMGIKETFLTLLFFMPTIAAHKHRIHGNKLEEIQNLPKVPRLPSNEVLGRTILIFISSLIASVLTMFICSYTYSNQTLKYIMLNTLIGLVIFALFVPYLITLWRKKGSRLDIILRMAINTIVFIFLVYLICLFSFKQSLHVAIYLVPILITCLLLVQTLLYSLIMKGSLKEYGRLLFSGLINTPKFSFMITCIVGVSIICTLQALDAMNLLTYFIVIIMNMIVFYIANTFIRNKKNEECIEGMNNFGLYNLRRFALEDNV